LTIAATAFTTGAAAVTATAAASSRLTAAATVAVAGATSQNEESRSQKARHLAVISESRFVGESRFVKAISLLFGFCRL
jgi:hypothetical protein